VFLKIFCRLALSSGGGPAFLWLQVVATDVKTSYLLVKRCETNIDMVAVPHDVSPLVTDYKLLLVITTSSLTLVITLCIHYAGNAQHQ
jgi:hypothetical protein